jgi:hypothetical protein
VLASFAPTRSDAAEREAALAEGEALLAGGCVGHNRFCAYAGEACSGARDRPGLRRHADALAADTRTEPTRWSDFHVRLGRAMADAGEGVAGARERLGSLSAEAGAARLLTIRRRIAARLAAPA